MQRALTYPDSCVPGAVTLAEKQPYLYLRSTIDARGPELQDSLVLHVQSNGETEVERYEKLAQNEGIAWSPIPSA